MERGFFASISDPTANGGGTFPCQRRQLSGEVMKAPSASIISCSNRKLILFGVLTSLRASTINFWLKFGCYCKILSKMCHVGFDKSYYYIWGYCEARKKKKKKTGNLCVKFFFIFGFFFSMFSHGTSRSPIVQDLPKCPKKGSAVWFGAKSIWCEGM